MLALILTLALTLTAGPPGSPGAAVRVVAWVPMPLDGVDVGSTVQQVVEILP